MRARPHTASGVSGGHRAGYMNSFRDVIGNRPCVPVQPPATVPRQTYTFSAPTEFSDSPDYRAGAVGQLRPQRTYQPVPPWQSYGMQRAVGRYQPVWPWQSFGMQPAVDRYQPVPPGPTLPPPHVPGPSSPFPQPPPTNGTQRPDPQIPPARVPPVYPSGQSFRLGAAEQPAYGLWGGRHWIPERWSQWLPSPRSGFYLPPPGQSYFMSRHQPVEESGQSYDFAPWKEPEWGDVPRPTSQSYSMPAGRPSFKYYPPIPPPQPQPTPGQSFRLGALPFQSFGFSGQAMPARLPRPPSFQRPVTASVCPPDCLCACGDNI